MPQTEETKPKNKGGRKPTAEMLSEVKEQSRAITTQEMWSGDEPEMPECLRGDPEALKEWRYIVNWLKAQNRLAGVERSLLAQYCLTFSLWSQAVNYINENGPIYINEHELQSVSPWEGKREKYAAELRAIMTNLLMTPQSRAAAEKTKTDDKPKAKTKAQTFFNS